MSITNITEHKFSKLASGENARIFHLDNGNIKVSITNFGASIVSIMVPDKNGIIADVVLGFSSASGYETQNEYIGVVVGRVANRIANGKFKINDTEYSTYINNGSNTLHGGMNGFDKKLWNYEIIDNRLVLSYHSVDMEEGFPGNLKVYVTYSLDEENGLLIEYSATSDKDTIINLTNHSYFNLNGHSKGDILRHNLQINSNEFIRVNENLIPTGEKILVEDTPFDFINFHKIGERISDDNDDLKICGGYDHTFIVNNDDENNSKGLNHIVTLTEEYYGRLLKVFTDSPGMHLYTGNFLHKNIIGKGNARYGKRSGVCFETQFFPDAINQDNFASPILKKGEEYRYKTLFTFDILK